MPFHVFIDMAVEPTAEGRARLAASIAARYRLPEAQILQYLSAGRFRVKSGVDEPTARKFAAELVALGAIVSVEDAQSGAKLPLGGGSGVAPPPPRPAVAPPAPPAMPPPRSGAAPGASAPAVSPSGQRFESGLAAAFGAGAAESPAGLGALDNLAGVSLSSIDGVDDGVAEPVGLSTASPPSGPMAADAFDAPDLHEAPLELAGEPKPKPKAQASAPGAPRPKAAGTPPPTAVPPLEVDEPAASPVAPHAPRTPSHARSAFAAPDDDAPLDLALGASQVARPPTRPGGAAAAAPAPPANLSAELTSLAEMPASAAPAPRASKARPAPLPVDGGPLAPYFAGKPRQRILAGAVLALVLGYLPATLYASSAEDSRYGKIRSELTLVQQGATTQAAWEALDEPEGPRRQAARDMERARGRIRSTAAFFWIAASAGVALAWFRKLA